MFAAQGAWLRFKMALHVMAWQTRQPHLAGFLGRTHRTVTCWLMCEGILALPKAANNTGLASLLLFGERHITFDYINSLTKLP